jgi:hypothetical protein
MTERSEPESKRELLEILQDERRRLDALIGRLSEAELIAPGIEGNRSNKDLLAHITDWEQRMILWIDDSLAGRAPQRPAPGMTWDDLDRLNEQTYLENKEKALVEVMPASRNSYTQALQAIQELTNDDLFDGTRYAWRNGDPLWHMVAANTWWHYKEHREQIEVWLQARA